MEYIKPDYPVFVVKCPKCKAKRDYSQKLPTTNLKNAVFTCRKCKHRSSVNSNIVSIKRKPKKSKKKSGDVKGNKKEGSTNNTDRILPTKDPGFKMFARWLSIPAYKGLHKWQEEHHNLTWKAKYDMTLVPRDHGKSVTMMVKYQWAMQYKNFDVLLLGWTDRRKEVAMYVYTFFAIHDLIIQDKRTSPFHFRLKNGGKFDCYLITSKETLGMHSEGEQMRFSELTEEDWLEFKGMFKHDIEKESEKVFDEKELEEYIKSRTGTTRKLWISIDDPIDISFMKERHKEEILELHFRSSLYPIHPDKWSFTGTCKFEDDFFHFIRATFGKQLVEYKRGTRNLDGSLLCPERFTARDQETYEVDILPYVVDAETLIPIRDEQGAFIPKKPKRDLDEVRLHVDEYAWWSEYEQEPHPITGEVWKEIEYELMLDSPVNRKHDLCIITVDRATTMKNTSDYTGCVILLRHSQTGNRIIIDDWSGNIRFDNLLLLVNEFAIEFHKKHENILIVMIVETQGGGDDFITMAKNLKVFVNENGDIVKNMIPELVSIEPIHNIGEKLSRIKERLYAPIKNGKLRLLKMKKGCEFEIEVLSFPYPAKLDAIDAVANAEFIILQKFHIVESEGSSQIEQLKTLFKKMDDRKYKEQIASSQDELIKFEIDNTGDSRIKRRYIMND